MEENSLAIGWLRINRTLTAIWYLFAFQYIFKVLDSTHTQKVEECRAEFDNDAKTRKVKNEIVEKNLQISNRYVIV